MKTLRGFGHKKCNQKNLDQFLLGFKEVLWEKDYSKEEPETYAISGEITYGNISIGIRGIFISHFIDISLLTSSNIDSITTYVERFRDITQWVSPQH